MSPNRCLRDIANQLIYGARPPELGVRCGLPRAGVPAFYPFDHLGAGFEEALTITTALLRDGVVDFASQYSTDRDCEIRPLGGRPDGPLILVTGGTGPRMVRLAADRADLWMLQTV